MLSKWGSTLLMTATILAAVSLLAEAHRVVLRPLSAKEVYKVLKAAGREDAVPEGRIVREGISAVSGFALGLTKGIGGSVLFDVVTSNTTQQWINNMNYTALLGSGLNASTFFDLVTPNATMEWLNSLNYTALFGFGGANAGSGSSPVVTPPPVQEICFKSRSLDDEGGDERQAATTSPTTGTGIGGTGGTATATATGTGTGTGTIVPTLPTTATTGTGTTGTGTISGTGTGTGGTATATPTTTGTGTGTGPTTVAPSNPSITCIVLQKPKVKRRKRRAVMRKMNRRHFK